MKTGARIQRKKESYLLAHTHTIRHEKYAIITQLNVFNESKYYLWIEKYSELLSVKNKFYSAPDFYETRANNTIL